MRKILAVDDEPGITHMIKLNLEATGDYEVMEEHLGEKALSTARSYRPDLILLDVMMPDADGSDIAAAIREDPVLRHTKVVFLTAIVSPAEVAPDGSAISGNIFLAKPVRTEALIACIERELNA